MMLASSEVSDATISASGIESFSILCQIEQDKFGFDAILKGEGSMKAEQGELQEASLDDIKKEMARPRVARIHTRGPAKPLACKSSHAHLVRESCGSRPGLSR